MIGQVNKYVMYLIEWKSNTIEKGTIIEWKVAYNAVNCSSGQF